jgi:hypothetical protein
VRLRVPECREFKQEESMDSLYGLVWLAIIVALVVGIYKTFTKMGYDDAWWMFIPILNILFMLKVADKPTWWVILAFIPFVNLIMLYVSWLVASKVATAYGKSSGFAVGLLLLGFIFYPILGFGSEKPQTVA